MMRWNRTTLTWVSERTTNIPISDWWNKNRKEFHALSQIEIISMPNGIGKGKIFINKTTSRLICPADERTIEMRLEGTDIGFYWETARIVGFAFDPRKKHFTDRAIDIARQIYEALGASEGFSSIPFLACFYVTQKTLVFHCGKWIGFADYLRAKHSLPNLSETGWGDS